MKWNTSLYDNKHGFVSKYGEEVLELLAPKQGERILDVGCGTGHLAHTISTSGASVVGIDSSSDMIATAKSAYPQIPFMVADASNFSLNDLEQSQPFDAIFSNAALHWVHAAEAAIVCMAKVLKTDGRFVVEFGGKRNVNQIVTALERAVLETTGHSTQKAINYFPSIGEYSSLLERYGLEVVWANLFDRPTPLEGDDNGLANWIRMFRDDVLKQYAPELQTEILNNVEQQLRPHLFHDNQWHADYRRLRLVAYKR